MPDNEKQKHLEQLEKQRLEAETAYNRSQEILSREGNGFIDKSVIDTLNKRRNILLDIEQQIKKVQSE